MTKDYKIIIIGAGAIGLSIAKILAESKIRSVLIIDKEDNYGKGTSSRNSEVIHSGVYYKKNSLKMKYCIKGNKLLYDFCKKNNVWYKNCGKLIIAQHNQSEDLKRLYDNAKTNGLTNIKLLNENQIMDYEPKIVGYAGLYIKSSGIFCAHSFMNKLYNISYNYSHDYLFKSKVIKSSRINGGYNTTILNAFGGNENVTSEWVVNCAGLNSDIIANSIESKAELPKIELSKGCYFKLSNIWRNVFQHLVYPLPDYKNGTLGIHLTIDRNGTAKLGPNAKLLKKRIEDYHVDDSQIEIFYKEASNYIRGLKLEDLSPDYSGIRPRIKNNDKFNDFYVKHEFDKNLPGWINLIGIESPGLTSSLAIAENVLSIINNFK